MSKKGSVRANSVAPGHPAENSQANTRFSLLQATAHRSGPLPIPEEFAHYDRVVPGAAERILRMAESELQHRHEVEKSAIVSSDQTESIAYRALARGQYVGLALSIICVLSATGTAIYGVHWSVSFALVGVPMLVTVRTLVNATTKK